MVELRAMAHLRKTGKNKFMVLARIVVVVEATEIFQWCVETEVMMGLQSNPS